MVPDRKKCLPLYLIRINFKTINRVSLKGHDFNLKMALILCSFYFVIMACDECHFTREETSIQRLWISLCHGRPGQERPKFIWGHNSVASCAGISSLETSRVGSCVSMVLKAKYRTDGAILWFWKNHLCMLLYVLPRWQSSEESTC